MVGYFPQKLKVVQLNFLCVLEEIQIELVADQKHYTKATI
jgi:hypothetical protein